MVRPVPWPMSTRSPIETGTLSSEKPVLDVTRTPSRMMTNATWAKIVPNGGHRNLSV